MKLRNTHFVGRGPNDRNLNITLCGHRVQPSQIVEELPTCDKCKRMSATPPGGSSPPECGRTYPSKHSGITMTCLREPGHEPMPGSCPGGGSSPGSEAPFDARYEAGELLAELPNGRFREVLPRVQDRLQAAYNRGLADRDAAVSRARAEGRAEGIEVAAEVCARRERECNGIAPKTTQAMFWENRALEAGCCRDAIARLSSTTETPPAKENR